MIFLWGDEIIWYKILVSGPKDNKKGHLASLLWVKLSLSQLNRAILGLPKAIKINSKEAKWPLILSFGPDTSILYQITSSPHKNIMKNHSICCEAKIGWKKTRFTNFFPIEGKQPKFFLMNPNHFEGQTLYPNRSKIAIVEHGDLATAQKLNFHEKFQNMKFW